MRRSCIGQGSLSIAAFSVVAVILLLSATALAQDQGWPRKADTTTSAVMIYQPQPQSLKGDMLSARSAVSITPKGKKTPVYGCAWFTSRIITNRDTRTVKLTNIQVTKARFPNVAASQSDSLSNVVKTVLPQLDLTISLDRLMASLQAAQDANDPPAAFSATPPNIVYVNYPAVLITLDGQPLLRQVSGSTLMRVVNTPFFMALDPGTSTYYLYGSGRWYSTSDILAGPWTPGAQPPAEVVNLQMQYQAQLQGTQQSATAGSIAPRVVIATQPTELISSNGDPQYTPVVDGQLLYMSNTDRDVFLDATTQTYYVLLSGRWYRSQSLDGPWTYVPPDALPASFSSIPPTSPKARVLSSVAGTQEASDAIYDAQIPQTAVISRSAAGPNVSYDGDPQFQTIGATDMSYALNTGFQVLRYGNSYYCCYQGVWYQANNPLGPWAVAIALPAQLPLIPATCPLYNTRYCNIYRYTADTVYVGYTPGYLGCYPYGPTVVWGTGWYYPGWYGRFYYPGPLTWGCGAGYVPWTGNWAFGIGFGPSWFNFGFGWGFGWNNWWGPCGFRDFDIDFNRRPIGQIHRPFREPDLDLFNRPENFRRNAVPPQARPLRPAPVAKGQPNNVFADRNGNVFRRTPNGWEQRQGNGWSRPVPPAPRTAPPPGQFPRPAPTPAPRPTAPPGGRPTQPSPRQMEPDFRARQHGDNRTNNFNHRYGGSAPHGTFIPPQGSAPRGSSPGGPSAPRGGQGGAGGGAHK